MASFTYRGAYLTWVAFQSAGGNRELLEIYNTGFTNKNNSIVESTRNELIGRLLAYVIELIGAFAGGGYGIAFPQSGIGKSGFNTPA